ncbi:MAG: NAD(P)-dependent glycerol-3-phosphate dehydrogenase [Lentisphaerae bacterium]|nr:NAD(P)-dependent glycerol-3-phosphate dehydrogenase [Lentisphaerota bacterium]
MTGRRICVIGDGGWGTALSIVLASNGHRVSVWGPFPETLSGIVSAAENIKYLPGVPLPSGIAWEPDPGTAVEDAELAVLAVPTKFLRSVAERFVDVLPDECRLLTVAKGLDRDTGKRMTQVAEEILGRGPVACLSGPSHAEEVARHLPTAVVAACSDVAFADDIQQIFTADWFRLYTSDDTAGVELGGALKNIVAISAGVSDGMGFGDNAKAALITRGLGEISRLGEALGARLATFAGLSGMGDLVVTCTSPHSRNRAVGEKIGRGESLEQILDSTELAVEGVWNCAIARDLAHEHDVDVPITEEVYSLLYEGKAPADALRSLMTRDTRPE